MVQLNFFLIKVWEELKKTFTREVGLAKDLIDRERITISIEDK